VAFLFLHRNLLSHSRVFSPTSGDNNGLRFLYFVQVYYFYVIVYLMPKSEHFNLICHE